MGTRLEDRKHHLSIGYYSCTNRRLPLVDYSFEFCLNYICVSHRGISFPEVNKSHATKTVQCLHFVNGFEFHFRYTCVLVVSVKESSLMLSWTRLRRFVQERRLSDPDFKPTTEHWPAFFLGSGDLEKDFDAS